MNNEALRAHLLKALSWVDAHLSFEAATDGLEYELQGKVPPGLPHSAWQLLEHLRVTQADILEFCVNPDYLERKWPEEYWPDSPVPPNSDSWSESRAAFILDRNRLARIASDPTIDLGAGVPPGTGQTYLRELLLVADHNSYHVGQMVFLRRVLGAWRE